METWGYDGDYYGEMTEGYGDEGFDEDVEPAYPDFVGEGYWYGSLENPEINFESTDNYPRRMESDDNFRISARAGGAEFIEDLESVGLSFDHIEDLVEDTQFLTSDEGLEILDLKDMVRGMIIGRGPEHAQGVADRMHDEGRLSDDAYEILSRQVRIYGKHAK